MLSVKQRISTLRLLQNDPQLPAGAAVGSGSAVPRSDGTPRSLLQEPLDSSVRSLLGSHVPQLQVPVGGSRPPRHRSLHHIQAGKVLLNSLIFVRI